MALRANIAALFLAAAPFSANAAAVAYGESIVASNGSSQGALVRIGLGASPTATILGLTGPVLIGSNLVYPWNIRGLSFGPDGTLYAVSDDQGVLLQIKQSNGQATLIGALGLGASASSRGLSMAVTCDGNAWLASGTSGNFWKVDTATGAATLVGNLGSTITGLAAQGNTLFGTGSQSSNQKLYTINTTTAKTTLVGAYGSTAGNVDTISPGFDSGAQLWAVLDNIPGNPNILWSDLAQITSTSGALSDIGPITGVPALQGVGIVGLAIASPCGDGVGASDPGPGYIQAPVLPTLGALILTALFIVVAAVVQAVPRRSR